MMIDNIKHMLPSLDLRPGKGLSIEEIDVLLVVLIKIFEEMGIPQFGSYILAVKEDKKPVERIISFNFPESRGQNSSSIKEGSRKIVEDVFEVAISRDKDPFTPIHRSHDLPTYLSLNYDGGHFICVFFEEGVGIQKLELVYIATSYILFELRNNDDVLEQSVTKCLNNSPEIVKTVDLITEEFSHHKMQILPEILDWKSWKVFKT